MNCSWCGREADTVSVQVIFEHSERQEYLCATCLLSFFAKIKKGDIHEEENTTPVGCGDA